MNVSKYLISALAMTTVLSGASTAAATAQPGGDGPITLRIGTDDVPGRPAADQIDEFARQVDELSGGELQIEPVWQAAGEGQDDWDQAVAQLVVDGDLDMGNIPARSWDTMRVTSLRSLHAPFLVTSDALMDAVVADNELAGEMLAGLNTTDVTGLALLPEGLRHVFSFSDPLLTPGDFDGITVRAPTSATAFALFEALGATADDFGGLGDLFPRGVSDGSIDAAESSFAFAGTLPAATTATGNVTLYPKVNVIVANTDAFDGLSEDHQGVLRDAALATRDWAIASNRDDADYASEYCANGGTIVLASEADLAALQEATSSVYDDLEEDEVTTAMIARIRELADGVDAPEPMVPCAYEPTAIEPSEPAGTAVDEAPADTEFPEGVYQMEITAEFLIDAGVDRATAFNHAGTWTLGFEDGQLLDPTCPGSSYTVEDSRVTIQMGPSGSGCGSAAGKILFSAGWTLEGDQLWFTDVRSGHGSDLLIETLFGGQPWTKIG